MARGKQLRDRVVEMRRVKASDLRRNSANWRLHPEEQHGALRAMLDDVGFVGAVIAREVDGGGLELIDGHLRAEEAGDSEVPVLVVDLDADEAAKVLATYDPLSALAVPDTDALAKLLGTIELDEHAELRKMVADMYDVVEHEAKADKTSEREVEGMALQPHEHYDYLVVLATTAQEWNVLCDRLGLQPSAQRRGRMGTARAMRASALLPRLA